MSHDWKSNRKVLATNPTRATVTEGGVDLYGPLRIQSSDIAINRRLWKKTYTKHAVGKKPFV